MGEMMYFLETWEEFVEYYGFRDKEQVYTNGAVLIPAFRVEQWLEHIKNRRLTMEIKERIDALTEAEAKAALYYLVNFVGATAICKTCPLHQECFHDIEATSCKERFLNWAIVDVEREARK